MLYFCIVKTLQIKLLAILLVLGTLNSVRAQTQGPNPPASSVVNGSGVAWVAASTTNGFVSDDIRCVTPLLNKDEVSEAITFTDFNFSIPSSSIIFGIVVEIERSASDLSGQGGDIEDNNVQLTADGLNFIGDNKALGTKWPKATDAIETYGGTADDWAAGLTPAMVNSSSFGVGISVIKKKNKQRSARIDAVTITVHYSVSLPVEVQDLNVVRQGRNAKILWSTASELDNDYFTVERSLDGSLWNAVGSVESMGNSAIHRNYVITDFEPLEGVSHYRLKQVDLNGNISYFGPRSFEFVSDEEQISYYPNPANSVLTIDRVKIGQESYEIYSYQGVRITEKTKALANDDHRLVLHLEDLDPGLYRIQIAGQSYSFIKK